MCVFVCVCKKRRGQVNIQTHTGSTHSTHRVRAANVPQHLFVLFQGIFPGLQRLLQPLHLPLPLRVLLLLLLLLLENKFLGLCSAE